LVYILEVGHGFMIRKMVWKDGHGCKVWMMGSKVIYGLIVVTFLRYDVHRTRFSRSNFVREVEP